MRSLRLRDGQLSTKDMEVLKENQSALDQNKATRDTVKDYSMQHDIELYWDFSEDAQRDLMVVLRFDGQEALLDAEELRRILRWV